MEITREYVHTLCTNAWNVESGAKGSDSDSWFGTDYVGTGPANEGEVLIQVTAAPAVCVWITPDGNDK